MLHATMATQILVLDQIRRARVKRKAEVLGTTLLSMSGIRIQLSFPARVGATAAVGSSHVGTSTAESE